MTVQSTDRKAGPFFSGTILPFDFKVFSKEDIQVIWTSAAGVEDILVLDSEYSVTLNPDQDNTPGGSVTLSTAISGGANAVIIGDLAYDQGTDIRNQGGFEPETIEDALDRVTILVQQLLEMAKRTLRIPASSSSNISTQLPQPTAGNVLGWNGEANQLVNLSPQDIATTVAFGTAFVDQFEGNAVDTEFSLSANPALLANMDVQVDGDSLRNGIDFVLLAGAVIKFTTPPAAPSVPGEPNIQVRGTVAVPQGFDTADVVVTQLPDSGLWTTVQGFINRMVSGVGASIVGAEDSSGGSLWITIQGFINRIISSAGASVIGFIQAGVGAVMRTVQDKLRERVDITDFGPIGDSVNGDDAVFQKAMDYMHKITDDTGAFGRLEWRGVIYLKTPKKFGKNWTLRGKGRGFTSTIVPMADFVGSYLFGIDGDDCIGGFAFRIRHEKFTIDNSLIATKAQLPITYLIDKAYDIKLDDVWVYNARGTAVQISLSNLVVLKDFSAYGVSADAASSEYAIRVLSAGSGGGGGGVKIINPDIEVWFKGIRQEAGSRVQIINPYCERNIVGWEAVGTTGGSLTVVGGEVESPGASGVAAVIAGNDVTVIGGRYTANGGSGLVVDPTSRRNNVKLLGVAGDITDSRNYAYKEVADTTRWYPSKVKNQKDVSDAVATDFYNIVCPFVASYFGVCDVTVNARDASGYSLWTAKYRFAFSNPDGTLRVTPIVEYAKTNVNISANYSLAITTALSASGSTITFRITGDSGGALGNGQSPRISTEAEMVQWDSAGPVYIQAV